MCLYVYVCDSISVCVFFSDEILFQYSVRIIIFFSFRLFSLNFKQE